MAVRDGFADAAKNAKKLAKALRSAGHKGPAEKYAALAELCVALKRAHLAAGARHILEEFTQQEVKRIEKVVPGLNRGMSGALIETSKGASALVKAGRLGRAKVGGGYQKTDTLLMDEDKDLNYWIVNSANLLGGVVTKVQHIFTTNNGTSHMGKLGFAFGPTYKETGTLSEIIKMMTVREADNSFFRSAGPKRRAIDRGMRRLEKGMGRLSRITQRSTNLPLYLSQRKVMKGAFNQDVMALFAEKFDGGNENGALTTLIKGAYPSARTSLTANETNETTDTTLMSPMAYVPRPPEPAGATGFRRGREGVAYQGVEINVEVKDQSETLTSPVGKRLRSIMEAGVGRRQFGLERLKVSHAFLDVTYSKDITASIRLLKDMENAGNHVVRTHLYRMVNEGISGIKEGDVLAEPGEVWPAAFLKTLKTSGSENPQETLEKVKTACDKLKNNYLQLIEAGSILRAARNHPGDDMKMKAEAAFETISKEIWGGQHPNGSGKPQRPPKTTSQITTFLAQSYDAVSLALGAVGVHLAILKNVTLPELDANDQVGFDSIDAANKAYKEVRELMNGFSLPISHDQLMRHSTIVSPSVSRKKEVKVGYHLRAGAKLNPFEALAKRLSNIPGLGWVDLGRGTMILEVNNGVGTAFVDVGVKYTCSQHPNLGRGGHFIDITLKGGMQAPFLGEVLKKMPDFLKTIMKKAKLNPADTGEEKTAGVDKNLSMMIASKLGAAVETLAKEAYMEGGLAAGVQIRFHAFPNTLGSSKTLGFGLQYMRFFTEEQLAVNGTLNINNGGVENLGGEANFQTGQRIVNPQFEYLGKDLSYHMLQFAGLDKILNSASTPKERKKLLDENPFVKSQFFSNKTIFEMVKNHAKFLESTKNGPVKKHYGFYMYHDKNYEGFLKSAAEQAFYADPGNMDPKNAPAESIYDRMTKNYASVKDVISAETELAGKQVFAKNLDLFDKITGKDIESKKPPSEVDVRVDYFLNNPDGQKILAAYCEIVRTYKEANASLMVNEGYRLQLREKGTVRKPDTLGPVSEASELEILAPDSERGSSGVPESPESETMVGSASDTEDESDTEYFDALNISVAEDESDTEDEPVDAPSNQTHKTPVPEAVEENKENLSENSKDVIKDVMQGELLRKGRPSTSKSVNLNTASSPDSSAALTEKSSRGRSSAGNNLRKLLGMNNAKESGVNKGAAVESNKPAKARQLPMMEDQRKLHKAANALFKKAGWKTSAQDDIEILRRLTDFEKTGNVKESDSGKLKKLIKDFENRVFPSTKPTLMSFPEYQHILQTTDEFVRERWMAGLSTPDKAALDDLAEQAELDERASLRTLLIKNADRPDGLKRETLEAYFNFESADDTGMLEQQVAAGLAALPADDQLIDVLDISRDALARQYGVRITMLVQNGDGHRVIPSVGEPGAPEVYILWVPGTDARDPGHFTPLYRIPKDTSQIEPSLDSDGEPESESNVTRPENAPAGRPTGNAGTDEPAGRSEDFKNTVLSSAETTGIPSDVVVPEGSAPEIQIVSDEVQKLQGEEIKFDTVVDANLDPRGARSALRERFLHAYQEFDPNNDRFDFDAASKQIETLTFRITGPLGFDPEAAPLSSLTAALSARAAPRLGYELGDLNDAELEKNFMSKWADPDRNNCLLDSLRQLNTHVYPPHEHPNLVRPTIANVRRRLVNTRLAVDGHQIEAAGMTGEVIARQYGVRLTILLWDPKSGLHTVQPTMGAPEDPEVYVQLKSGHYSPLFPREEVIQQA